MTKFYLSFLFLVVSSSLFSQSGQVNGTVLQNAGGYAKIPTPTSIYVCSYNVQNSCITPSGEIAIYSDSALTKSITQPLVTTASGKYSYFLPSGTLALEKDCFTAQQCQISQVFTSSGGGILPPSAQLLGGTGTAFTAVTLGSGLNLTAGVLSSTGSGIGSITWALPSFLTASPNPLSASGTQTFTLATQAANTFFAGPASGSAAIPTFRAIAVADVPLLNQNTTGTAGGLSGSPAIVVSSCTGCGSGSFSALTGDATSTSSGGATTVKGINGTLLSGLSTGILKNTTTSGVPSIAIASDFPTLNQNTTGTAGGLSGSPAITVSSCTGCGGSSGISGLTTGQVGIAGSATTLTSSMPLAGSGLGIVTGPTSAPAADLPVFTGTTGGIVDSGVTISSLAPKASPALTGTPTAPTATVGTNTTQIATTAFVLANTTTGISGQAAGVIPLAGTATTITAQSHLDDGVTTSGTVTSTEPIAVTGSVHGITLPAGTAVSGVAGSVIYASDATNGYAEVNENATGLTRLCSVLNMASVCKTFTSITVAEIDTTGTTPTMAPGAAAGTSPTCTTVSGHNVSGVLTCTTGIATTTGIVATITFSGTLGTAPQGCVIMPRNNAAALFSTSAYTTAPSTTSWTITTDAVAPTTSVAYSWSYECL